VILFQYRSACGSSYTFPTVEDPSAMKYVPSSCVDLTDRIRSCGQQHLSYVKMLHALANNFPQCPIIIIFKYKKYLETSCSVYFYYYIYCIRDQIFSF